jgi:voltage-gated potassium channel Kch
MQAFLGSPWRNLAVIVAFLATVTIVATLAYTAAGWSLADAFYMVVLTIYTVGFREVHPIDGFYLRTVTIGVMFLGCTGMILMTGALVQLFTASEIRNLLGSNRVKNDIDRLKGHIVVCGFGRIGGMLGRELADSDAPFVIIEHDEKRADEARKLGFLCLAADATDEAALIAAGVERARALATVLPDDAANVFITLSARSLNRGLQIIARGEAPSTERKLIHAGADKVILPTHIGAERIAELLLAPATARLVRGSRRTGAIERTLREVGLEIEVVSVGEHAGVAGLTVEQVERRAGGAVFVARIERPGVDPIVAPAGDARIESGDGLVVVGRSIAAFRAAFAARARPAADR